MTRLTNIALLAAGLLTSTTAAASDWEWPWEQDDIPEIWNAETLSWASDIHPSSPSPLVLLVSTTPPPRQAWCVDSSTPNANILWTHDQMLEDWLHEFLDIAPHQPIPAPILADFPDEC